MQRAFEVDVLACPHCDGRLRLIALVEDSQAISGILPGLVRPSEPGDRGEPVPLGAHPIRRDSPHR